MKALLASLAAVVVVALPAFAIQPAPTDAPAPRPGPRAANAPEAVPDAVTDRVRMREEAQARYLEVRERRREAFLAAAKEMAPPVAATVPGWREARVRPGSAAEAAKEEVAGSPLLLGRPFLIFAGVTGALVLILALGNRRRSRPAKEPRPKKLPKGAMTVKLRPRVTRFADAARRP